MWPDLINDGIAVDAMKEADPYYNSRQLPAEALRKRKDELRKDGKAAFHIAVSILL
jgi:hypothetical protein